MLWLGHIPAPNDMQTDAARYPTQVVRCDDCSLAQLACVLPTEVIFPKSYPYRSRVTKALREDFADLAREARERLTLTPEDLVVDIGSNDGTLLEAFAGHRVMGIEPTDAALDAKVPTIQAPLSDHAVVLVTGMMGKAALVTATNVFAHIPDPLGAARLVTELMAPDGVFVSESHYWNALVDGLQYDAVYHEHLRYYTIRSLSALLESVGLHVFAVTPIPTHGGSIRVWADRGEREAEAFSPASGDVEMGVDNFTFQWRVIEHRKKMLDLPWPMFGVSAPSRSTTLINYVGIDHHMMPAVGEVKGSAKIGLVVPGTRIPIVDESEIMAAERVMILSHHIAFDLVSGLRRKGYEGEVYVPLPRPERIA